jgi:hypothetical protein
LGNMTIIHGSVTTTSSSGAAVRSSNR